MSTEVENGTQAVETSPRGSDVVIPFRTAGWTDVEAAGKAIAHGQDPAEAILNVLNERQRNGAAQAARNAYSRAEGTEEERLAEAAKAGADFILGQPRGQRRGPTKTKARNFGVAMIEAEEKKGGPLTMAEIRELRSQFGL